MDSNQDQLVIKKREFRTVSTKRAILSDSDDENEGNVSISETDINREKLKMVKLEQKLRDKKNGIAVNQDIGLKNDSKSKNSQLDANLSSDSFHSQFHSRIEDGFGNSSRDGMIVHEKIMEKFVEEKLGLSKSSEPKNRLVQM